MIAPYVLVLWNADCVMAASLSSLCETLLNLTRTEIKEVNATAKALGLQEEDRHALLYIVVTLLFYSLGIIIGIITYLKREKREIEEERRYEEYINFRNDPDKNSRYFSVQRMVNHLNNVEAEAEKRRQLEEEEEEEEEEKRKKRSFISTLRRLSSGGDKPNKKRFSLIETSLFPSKSSSKGSPRDEKRRWSLKPMTKINVDVKGPSKRSLPSPKEEIEIEEEALECDIVRVHVSPKDMMDGIAWPCMKTEAVNHCIWQQAFGTRRTGFVDRLALRPAASGDDLIKY
ncbi:hypothetical protein CAPTEDRAFT_217913 [Capitella teleta]|uniref:Uncharacterized protein n=1 Tax=Capitella teleta TaxID=283909 RepID=R7VC79_CAPTE|nr:hypothetical protein CAPTEDRAFT_217913 [Capitella teleta]|eukprot:ELU13285.1 hypothetical protein CAPTEDRAFT_217913 [Capitella teleta]